jgi:hypothetical protein
MVIYTRLLLSRYCTSNLMCTSILPGPKEQNPDKIQWFLCPIISNLLRLWKDGIRVPTESRPEGEVQITTSHATDNVLNPTGCLVHVILVTVVCDKPAAHKMGGFGSHSHTNFCTLCWIPVHNKGKPIAFQDGGASHLFLGHLQVLLTHHSLPPLDK